MRYTCEDVRADFRLMIWEENPNKRNENNIIKFNILDKFNVEKEDVLAVSIGSGKHSNYEITEVIESRPSSLSGYNYVTAKTKWYIS